jgi:hypothetical protein
MSRKNGGLRRLRPRTSSASAVLPVDAGGRTVAGDHQHLGFELLDPGDRRVSPFMNDYRALSVGREAYLRFSTIQECPYIQSVQLMFLPMFAGLVGKLVP